MKRFVNGKAADGLNWKLDEDVKVPRVVTKKKAPSAGVGSFPANEFDLICLSHLRWNFVFQRPQHLLTRCAKNRRVFFIEEPFFDDGAGAFPRLEISQGPDRVVVVVPHLPRGAGLTAAHEMQRSLLDELFSSYGISNYVFWYYTPMALPFTCHLDPLAVVYDCMDELSAFRGAPTALKVLEADLLKRAEVMFTGGHCLYEAKRDFHPNVHPVPSSVEVAHFAKARSSDPALEPSDQRDIPRVRLGFFGVIDERMNLELIDGIARERPDWHLIFLGPFCKIDPAHAPRRPNIHYLGQKQYADLPRYLAGWDVALLPFALNESTRYISPTKTPEYLAAGKPVVSTSIRDVVRPYGELGLVHIADDVPSFIRAIETALRDEVGNAHWLSRVDALLSQNSWDLTWARMEALMCEALRPSKQSRLSAGA